MSEYSEADTRVISFLRKGPRTTTEIAGVCFRSGGRRLSGVRPAAAHLARMEERGLVRKVGARERARWELTERVTDTGGDLFGEVPSAKFQVPKERP